MYSLPKEKDEMKEDVFLGMTDVTLDQMIVGMPITGYLSPYLSISVKLIGDIFFPYKVVQS